MSVDSVVTSITPTATGRAPKTNGASMPKTSTASAKKGRPALILKDGRTYAQAKADIKVTIVTTKRALADAKTLLKSRERDQAANTKAHAKTVKAADKANALLAKNPKDAVAKQAVKDAKAAVKAGGVGLKAGEKLIAAEQKYVVRAQAAYDKAHGALLKLEADKRERLN